MCCCFCCKSNLAIFLRSLSLPPSLAANWLLLKFQFYGSLSLFLYNYVCAIANMLYGLFWIFSYFPPLTPRGGGEL